MRLCCEFRSTCKRMHLARGGNQGGQCFDLGGVANQEAISMRCIERSTQGNFRPDASGLTTGNCKARTNHRMPLLARTGLVSAVLHISAVTQLA